MLLFVLRGVVVGLQRCRGSLPVAASSSDLCGCVQWVLWWACGLAWCLNPCYYWIACGPHIRELKGAGDWESLFIAGAPVEH